MKSLDRLSILLVLAAPVVGLLVALAVGPETPVPAGPGASRVAYVDLEGGVWTVGADGSDPRRISPDVDGFFTWPTWSPDATRVAFSGVVRDGEGAPRVSLYLSDPWGRDVRELYTNEPGAVGLLAEGVVHYVLWSPDGTKLAFIAITSKGLTLFLKLLGTGESPVPVLDQGPLWMSWSPDSRYLLVHRGLEQFLVDTEGGIEVTPFDLRAVSYRVPAWNPIHDEIAYVSGRGFGQYRLYIGDLASLRQRVVTQVPRQAAFLWSSDGRYLAVALSLLPGGVVYQDLSLYTADGQRRRVGTLGNVVAFFWSPDGRRLAYVTADEEGSVLRWNVLEPDTGENKVVAEFLPSSDQLVLLEFFDQYAYSHSPWSPDGTYLVFAGRLRGKATTASLASAQGSEIIVADVRSQGLTQVLAPGRLAFWSPR